MTARMSQALAGQVLLISALLSGLLRPVPSLATCPGAVKYTRKVRGSIGQHSGKALSPQATCQQRHDDEAMRKNDAGTR